METRLSSRPVRVVLLLALFLWPWSFVGHGYGRCVAAVAHFAAAVAGTGATLRVTSPDETTTPSPAWHLQVHVEDPITGRYVGMLLDLRRSAYIATAVFVALVLATPLRPRKKVGVVITGFALLQTLAVLPLVSFFSGKLPVRLFDLGPVARAAVEMAYHALVTPPGMAYALPALLWLLAVWLVEPGCLRLPWTTWVHRLRSHS